MCAFFVLSGYWVTKSYLKNKNVKYFYVRRALRIFPLYFLTVIGFAVGLVFFSTFSAQDYFANVHFLKYIFWNCMTLNFVCPSLPGVFDGNAVNGALWTIKVEIGFYLVLPLLILILEKLPQRRHRNAFLLVVYTLSVLWNFMLAACAEKYGIPKQISYQLPGFMSFFVSGMIYVYNEDAIHRFDRYMLLPAILLFTAHYFTKTEYLMPFVLAYLIMFLGTRLCFLSKIGRPVDYSYAMYLFHFPLINIFTRLGFFSHAPVFAMLMIIASTLGMAFIAEKYIQQKVNALIK